MSTRHLDPQSRGQHDFNAGVKEDDCPWPDGCPEATLWHAGWFLARDEKGVEPVSDKSGEPPIEVHLRGNGTRFWITDSEGREIKSAQVVIEPMANGGFNVTAAFVVAKADIVA